jgi:formate dehydrogenase iron-sulfur subunit
MPDLRWNYYNLIRFNEHEFADGTFGLLMRKDQCMHCADPGCLRACPAEGAIVQYANGIVDFKQENCIGCQYCVTGCPFNIPKFNSQGPQVYTVFGSRGRRTGAGVHKGLPHRMPALRQQG